MVHIVNMYTVSVCCLAVFMSICLSVCLSGCVSVCFMSGRLPMCLFFLFVWLYVCLSVCLSFFSLYLCLHVRLFVCALVGLSAKMSDNCESVFSLPLGAPLSVYLRYLCCICVLIFRMARFPLFFSVIIH